MVEEHLAANDRERRSLGIAKTLGWFFTCRLYARCSALANEWWLHCTERERERRGWSREAWGALSERERDWERFYVRNSKINRKGNASIPKKCTYRMARRAMCVAIDWRLRCRFRFVFFTSIWSFTSSSSINSWPSIGLACSSGAGVRSYSAELCV